MSLNIKSPTGHALAAELARLTGESMTKAVTEAIRERLERKQRERDCDGDSPTCGQLSAQGSSLSRRISLQ